MNWQWTNRNEVDTRCIMLTWRRLTFVSLIFARVSKETSSRTITPVPASIDQTTHKTKIKGLWNEIGGKKTFHFWPRLTTWWYCKCSICYYNSLCLSHSRSVSKNSIIIKHLSMQVSTATLAFSVKQYGKILTELPTFGPSNRDNPWWGMKISLFWQMTHYISKTKQNRHSYCWPPIGSHTWSI